MKNPFEQVESIDFLDIGCSGSLDRKWAELFPLLSYIGFDPNAEECKRLESQPSPYRSARYLPYAIAGEEGAHTLYKTANPACYSLLRPNYPWINRFSFSDLFNEKGTTSVACTTLNTLVHEQGVKADIIKLDAQGVELPILKEGTLLLEKAFCVETETGFVENYIGETPYAQLDQFMRSKGYLMFDIYIYRVARKNFLADTGKHQPLWCEAIWLYDYIGQEKEPTLEEALKALLICKTLKCFDYGVELARYFKHLSIIDRETLVFYEGIENWVTKRKQLSSKTANVLNLLPKRIKWKLLYALKDILEA